MKGLIRWFKKNWLWVLIGALIFGYARKTKADIEAGKSK